ncbi:hypothetical protein CHS0354_024329 [Potamilus streckersoni]|uniref:Uncharacterized protein n=1 Tax=Potamilus streckersoni TaxID=2493646 RepID=A0AAE0W4U6_9BIVA|nr:hypothetical protein CHS0354_024329 [Potamilus streckersoni]
MNRLVPSHEYGGLLDPISYRDPASVPKSRSCKLAALKKASSSVKCIHNAVNVLRGTHYAQSAARPDEKKKTHKKRRVQCCPHSGKFPT